MMVVQLGKDPEKTVISILREVLLSSNNFTITFLTIWLSSLVSRAQCHSAFSGRCINWWGGNHNPTFRLISKLKLVMTDKLIDKVQGNRKYVKCLYVYNKIDTITMEKVNILAHQPNSLVASVHMNVSTTLCIRISALNINIDWYLFLAAQLGLSARGNVGKNGSCTHLYKTQGWRKLLCKQMLDWAVLPQTDLQEITFSHNAFIEIFFSHQILQSLSYSRDGVTASRLRAL